MILDNGYQIYTYLWYAKHLWMYEQVVSNILLSGMSCLSGEVRTLRSHLDTLRDMGGDHAWQSISQRRWRGLFSPTCNRLGLRKSHSGWEKSLDLWMSWLRDSWHRRRPWASTTCWHVESGSQCNLLSDTTLCVKNLNWYSPGWMPIKSTTQLNYSVAWGI